MSTSDLTELCDAAVDLLAQHLDVPLAKVLERVPGTTSLLLKSGVGWVDGLVGAAMVPTVIDSQAGYPGP